MEMTRRLMFWQFSCKYRSVLKEFERDMFSAKNGTKRVEVGPCGGASP